MTARCDASRARAALRGLRSDFARMVEDGCRVAATNAEAAAKATSDWRDQTGKTRSSIRGVPSRTGFRLVGGGASVFLENGTAAHVIAATRVKTLRFVVNGETVFRRDVYHPGTKATFFLERAVAEGAQALSRNFPRVFARAAALRGLGR